MLCRICDKCGSTSLETTAAISHTISEMKFLSFRVLITLNLFMESFHYDPCSYFYQFQAKQKKLLKTCSGSLDMPNNGNILETHSVRNKMECVVKCSSYTGCKAVDYITSRNIENCQLFYHRNISGCQSDSAIFHYDIVSSLMFYTPHFGEFWSKIWETGVDCDTFFVKMFK